MQRKLGKVYKSVIFILLFSIVLLYQNWFIISTHQFTTDLKGAIQSQTVTYKAYSQSYGFFDGVSNSNWEKYQLRYKNQHRHVDNDVRNKRRHIDVNHGDEDRQDENSSLRTTSHLFFRDNYDGEFTCLNEMQVGVAHDHLPHHSLQTPKWICDPDRIVTSSRERKRSGSNSCLIYTIDDGAGNPMKFLKDLRDEVGEECEIHAFAPHWNAKRIQHLFDDGAGAILHNWGLEGKSDSHLGRKNYLTFQETLAQLGHVGHTIDVLSVDCNDGCEWSTYKEILGSDSFITQILIELHGAPYQVNDFFLEMRRSGYVAFHKESNTVDNGQSMVFSFIQLAPAFFEESAALSTGVNDKRQKKDARAQAHPQEIHNTEEYQRRPLHFTPE
mmetsp:Transcript_13074/g.19582  ORF Transcript_13074/g.19582 Transcript_13074/m.19582 type:complete len:385 (+) Transcript_13074:162-1316(+)